MPAVIVYERPGGVTPADQQAVNDQMAELSQVEGVTDGVKGPISSKDGQTLQVIAPVDMSSGGRETLGEVTPELRDITDDTDDGLSAYVTGPAGVSGDFADAFAGIDSTLLMATAGVAMLLLLLTYRSPILWLLPVITAAVALVCARRAWFIAVGITQLDAEGLTNEETLTDRPESIVGQEVVAEHFPAGAAQTVYIITDGEQTDAVSDAVAATAGIADVTPGGRADGRVLLDGTLEVPADSPRAREIVEDVRSAVHDVDGANAIVGGDTAVLLDTLEAAAQDNVVIIPIVLAVVFVILTILLRALLAPIILWAP